MIYKQKKLIEKYDIYNNLCIVPSTFEIRDLTKEDVQFFLVDLQADVLELNDAMLILKICKEMAKILPELSQIRRVANQLIIIKEHRRWENT